MTEPADAELEEILNRSSELMATASRAADAQVVELLRAAVERYPNHVDLLLRAAACLYDSAPAEASALVVRAADLAHDDPDQITSCAMLMFDLGDFGKARAYAVQARNLAPEGDFALAAELVHLVGKLAYEAGDMETAERQLRFAFTHDPDMPGHGRVLARLLAEQGRMAEAYDVVRVALRHLPNDESLQSLRRELSHHRAVRRRRPG